MLESDRRGAIAAGLGIAFIAVFLVGLWAGATYRYYGNPYSESYQTAYPAADKDTSGHDVLGAQPRYFKDVCERPQSHDDADLCQQWRSANGTRDAAQWGLLQLGLGVVGIFGLAGTIYFAWRAYGAARDAVTETRRIGEAQTRAYVTIHSIRVRYSVGRFWVAGLYKNTGATPAGEIGISLWSVIVEGSAKPDFGTVNGWSSFFIPSLPAQGDDTPFEWRIEQIDLGGIEYPGWRKTNSVLHLRFEIGYVDVFERRQSELQFAQIRINGKMNAYRNVSGFPHLPRHAIEFPKARGSDEHQRGPNHGPHPWCF
jgi:hypothetical protein